MRNAQLGQQRRGNVDLRGVLFHHAGFRDRTARPDHRDAVTQGLVVGQRPRVGIAVVGHQHHEQVFPRGRGFQAVDHLPYALVGEGHGVQHLVIELRIGDVEGRMAAQREQPRKKRFSGIVQRDHPVGEPVAHQRIVVTPIGRRSVETQVLLPDQLLPPRSVHVGGLIREIEVAAIGKTRRIALSGQRTGHRRQAAALGREFHDRHARLGRKSAKNRHLATVGAERIGEKILEPDALALQPLHVRHDGLPVDLGIHHRAGKTLQNDDHDVRTAGVQHRLRRSCRRSVAPQGVELRGAHRFFEERIFVGIIDPVAQTGEEREDGIRGGMVQKLRRAEIDLRDIGHRSPRTAPDGQKIESGEHHYGDAAQQSDPPADSASVENTENTAVAPDHPRRIDRRQQRLPHAEPEIDTRHRLLGIGEVDQHRRIDAESPMLVQGDIDGEDHGRRHGDQHEPSRQHTPPQPLREANPQREQRHENRQHGDIPRDRKVERQAVPQHVDPPAKARSGCLHGVISHEHGFLHGHHHNGRTEHGNGESEFSAHYLFIFFDFRQGSFGHRAARDGWVVLKYVPFVTRKGCAKIAA